MFWSPILLNLQHCNCSSLSYNNSQVWGSFSWITFQPLGGNCQILLCCFVCQYTCTLLQNEDFIRILFVECKSRLLSDGGQYSHTNESNIAATKEGVKKGFLQNLRRDLNIDLLFLSSTNFYNL